jgi:amino acid transporter
MTENPSRRPVLLLAACFAISLIAVAYPMYVIRPFRAQGARELAAALVILRFRSVVTVVSVIAAIAALVAYWRAQPSRWRRALASISALIVAALALLARVNVYERMFHPAGRPVFAAASESRLDGDEKVIAVRQGNAARAYPVRIISYHHVINDEVDGKALVATY